MGNPQTRRGWLAILGLLVFASLWLGVHLLTVDSPDDAALQHHGGHVAHEAHEDDTRRSESEGSSADPHPVEPHPVEPHPIVIP